jgi:hypothetical protein
LTSCSPVCLLPVLPALPTPPEDLFLPCLDQPLTPFKQLYIPRAIDDYNHYTNAVDRSNQLRNNFTAHQPYERRIWRLLWYYILDVYAVNDYLIWKGNTVDQRKRGQRHYRESLINALLNTSPPASTSIQQPSYTHRWERFEKRGYCL